MRPERQMMEGCMLAACGFLVTCCLPLLYCVAFSFAWNARVEHALPAFRTALGVNLFLGIATMGFAAHILTWAQRACGSRPYRTGQQL